MNSSVSKMDIARHFKERIGNEEQSQGNVVLHAMKLEVLVKAGNFRISDVAAIDEGKTGKAMSTRRPSLRS